MCDIKLQRTVDDLVEGGNAAIFKSSFDNISMQSEASVEKGEMQHSMCEQQRDSQNQLHQTTQSLMMASSMLVGSINNVGGETYQDRTENDMINNHHHSQGHYSSASIFGSTDSMNTQFTNMTATHTPRSSIGHLMMNPQNVQTMHINVHELVIENHALREQLREISADRDRLLCEVSNLRLELDMIELKRLPEES